MSNNILPKFIKSSENECINAYKLDNDIYIEKNGSADAHCSRAKNIIETLGGIDINDVIIKLHLKT